ncbi:AraC family transcriptional regulator [Amycolatopsis decaplanina]|uniref:AraC family transcriptional regulator n=1 Tax=Amycolatopsis decaplanina DSM 44594 TaxID=1284240 RepID=M2XUJ6_9PSEU|nr:helix-turn-helix transcriptional regulator [Amycolatopsis decaplanina]EME64606.1 AraC family transcriptional regulator [Amycolatopsis decaplanina DSM 44594]
MSRIGLPSPMPTVMVLGGLDLPSGYWLPWHEHDCHQLAWAARGILSVNIGERNWVLPPTRALWIPAGVLHRTGATAQTVLRRIYAAQGQCPVRWPVPTLVAVRPLLRELLEHLGSADFEEGARLRAEAVAFDLLEPVDVVPINVPMPSDERALTVARAVIADPADRRSLADFARDAGASERTLARLFLTECRTTFGAWRVQARLRASLPLLAEGMPLSAVSRRIGYSSPSAFVVAFRKAVGVTPGAYFDG